MEQPALTFTAFKNASYLPAILLGLSIESYTILAILMVIDTIFGVTRVLVVHGGVHIKSYKLTAGITAKLSILLLPLLIAWVGRGANIDLSMIARGTLGVLILSEFYSILGSMYSMRIMKDVPEYDAVSAVIRSVRNIIEKLIKTK